MKKEHGTVQGNLSFSGIIEIIRVFCFCSFERSLFCSHIQMTKISILVHSWTDWREILLFKPCKICGNYNDNFSLFSECRQLHFVERGHVDGYYT